VLYSGAISKLKDANNSIEILNVLRKFDFDMQFKASILLEDTSAVSNKRHNGIDYRKRTLESFMSKAKVISAFEDADKNFETWSKTNQRILKRFVDQYRELKSHNKHCAEHIHFRNLCKNTILEQTLLYDKAVWNNKYPPYVLLNC